MSYNDNISYQQILSLIHQLPKEERNKLIATLQSEKLSEKNDESGSFEQLIMNAPTWTDSELKKFQKARNNINKSRIA